MSASAAILYPVRGLDLITPSVSDSCVEKISLCVATTGWVRREDLEICEYSYTDLEGSLLALLGLKEPRCGSKGIAGTNSGYPAITGGRSGKDTCLSLPPNPRDPRCGSWTFTGPVARSLVWTSSTPTSVPGVDLGLLVWALYFIELR